MGNCRQLSCGTPSVYVTDRCGERTLYEVTGISELAWGRVIDESSEAAVAISLSGDADMACCQGIGDTRSWAHGLVIHRDGERVWEGPIVDIGENRDQAVITARDVTAWLDVRTTHTPINHAGNPVDLSLIAAEVIISALEPDDPCIQPYVFVNGSGVTAEKELAPNEEYAGDVLRELARSGLDYTTIGRRILIGPDVGGIYPGGGVAFAHLLDEHFVGGLTILEAGLEAGTRWIVKGDGVTGIAGGIDPYYGLIEQIAKEDGVQQQSLVNASAQSRLAATNPPPLYIDTGQGFGLDPAAPVCIEDLIPGRLLAVTARDHCRQVTEAMRLVAVNVRYTEQAGETVGITLAPVGTLTTQTQPTR
jgi:hypothetical protein